MGNCNKHINQYVNLSQMHPQAWDSVPSIIAMTDCGKVVLVDKPVQELTGSDREKLDSILIDGDGTLFLANDGRYKYMDLDNIPHIILTYEKYPSNFVINNLEKIKEIRELADAGMETFVRMDFGHQILPVSIRYNEKQLILEFDHILLSHPRQKDRPFSKLKLLIFLDTTKKIPKVIHYEVKTGVDADDVLFIDGDGSEALFNDGTYKPAYTKEQVDNLINVYLSDYYTKEQLDEIIRLNNGNYYTSEEVDRIIRENNENYYTKEEIDTTLDGYYTQEESDKNLSDAVENAVFYDDEDNIHPRKDVYLRNGRNLYGVASNEGIHPIAGLSEVDTVKLGSDKLRMELSSSERPGVQLKDQAVSESVAFVSDVEYAASAWQEKLGDVQTDLQEKLDQTNQQLSDHTGEFETYKTAVEDNFDAVNDSINGLDKRVTANEVATGENKEDILHIREDLASRELFRGYYLTTHEITALENPHKGNYAWNAETGTVWCYNGTTWSDSGEEIPDQTVHAYNDTPQRDGEAFAGDSNEYARGDHRHPTDISRAAITDLDNYLPLAGNSSDTPVTGSIWMGSGNAIYMTTSGNSSLQQDINSQTTILRGDGTGGIDLTSASGTIKANGQRIIVQGENESNVRVHAPYVQLGSSDSSVTLTSGAARVTGETIAISAAKDIKVESTEGNIILDPAGTLYYGNPSFASNQVATVGDIEAAGYLPLSGGTITGNLNINGEANLNGSPVATAATLDSYYTKDAVDTIQSGLQSQIDQTGVEFNEHLGEYEEYRELVSSSFENVNEEITTLDRRTGKNEAAIEANSQDIDTLREDLASRELFRGYYLTTNEITAIEDPKPGDYTWNVQTGTVWYYNGTTWADTENIIPDQTVVAYDGTPQRDGEATPGASNEYARGDHRHPVDITRAAVTDLDNYLPVSGGRLEGDLTIPGTNAINLQDYSGAELQLKGDGLTKATGSIRVTASGDTAEVTISGKKAVNIETGTFQYNGEEVATEAGLSDLANQASATYVAKAGDTMTGSLRVTGGNITLDADQSLRFSGNGAVRAEYNTAEGRLNIITTTTDNGINVATNPSAESSKFTYNGVEVATLDDVLEKTDILDNLASDRTDAALSANQGRVLDDKIKTEIEDRSAADAVLGVRITNEINRSQEAEALLKEAIEAEVTRGLEAEAELRQSIEDETDRAKAEEKRISDAVEELDESLSNYVTLDTDQTIEGRKLFNATIRTTNHLYTGGKTGSNDGKPGCAITGSNGFIGITSDANPYIAFFVNNSTERSSILYGGDGYLFTNQRLAIGTTSNSTYRLHVAGTSFLNGTVTATASMYVGSTLYTGGKTTATDGVSGVLVGNGYLELSASGQPFIDFHYQNSTEDYTSRIIETTEGELAIPGKLKIGTASTTASGYTFYVNGTARITSDIYGSASIFTNAKTSSSDGIQGVEVAANGYIALTSDTSPDIRFYRANGTEATARIQNSGDGFLNISGRLGVGAQTNNSNYTLYVTGNQFTTGNIVTSGELLPSITDTLNIGSSNYKWNELHVRKIIADEIDGMVLEETDPIFTGWKTADYVDLGASETYRMTLKAKEFILDADFVQLMGISLLKSDNPYYNGCYLDARGIYSLVSQTNAVLQVGEANGYLSPVIRIGANDETKSAVIRGDNHGGIGIETSGQFNVYSSRSFVIGGESGSFTADETLEISAETVSIKGKEFITTGDGTNFLSDDGEYKQLSERFYFDFQTYDSEIIEISKEEAERFWNAAVNQVPIYISYNWPGADENEGPSFKLLNIVDTVFDDEYQHEEGGYLGRQVSGIYADFDGNHEISLEIVEYTIPDPEEEEEPENEYSIFRYKQNFVTSYPNRISLVTNGSGDHFLADDGRYKTIPTGARMADDVVLQQIALLEERIRQLEEKLAQG